MHIPDGYLGPQTYVPLYGAAISLWAIALKKLRTTLRLQQVPLLALSAAFSFVIMMFNIPIPGGTTGHAVGAVLIAILLGPWAAMIAVSLALMLQALIFADGGLTALGANCFNMAIVMPWVGFGVYRIITAGAPVNSRRHYWGAALGGYVGLSAAAILTGFEFGVQPLLAHDTAGRALYCPFGIKLAVSAMALEHLLVFSWIEAAVTGLVIGYFQRSAPEMLKYAHNPPSGYAWRILPGVALLIGLLIILSPLGLFLPAHFNAGSAWGEWDIRELSAFMAADSGSKNTAIPEGLLRAEQSGWRALLPDYDLPRSNPASPAARNFSYILSAAVGVMLLGIVIMLGKNLLARKDKADGPAAVDG